MTFALKIREISKVISAWKGPVVVAYSGGKDSSAVLKLVFNTVIAKPHLAKKITVIYCDTKVENPILDQFVKRVLRNLKNEVADLGLKLNVRVLVPQLHQRYFVRVIGRGYPPPTTFFRWCTKDLRIRPVQRFVKRLGGKPLVLIGTRTGESVQRDRVLKRVGRISKTGPVMQRQIDGNVDTHLYLPIADYSLDDVWECLTELTSPISIDVPQLTEIYREGGGECPVIRDSNDKPCASARFGCWVCTVVRKDRSAERLLAAGHAELQAYYLFREWLKDIRNQPIFRCAKRRNGRIAPGPFTLDARKLILKRVRQLEKTIGRSLITKAEEKYIRKLWAADRSSQVYSEIERYTEQVGIAISIL